MIARQARHTRMSITAISPEDIALVDPRLDARVNVSLPGRYSLANRRNTRGERREFACSTLTISSQSIALVAPITGPIGERVIAHFEELGKLEGLILGLIEDGFEFRLVLARNQRTALMAKIEWLQKRCIGKLDDYRNHKRAVPTRALTSVLFSDGRTCSGVLIDVSVSGAAVFAELRPRHGDVLAIGRVIGRVVRVFSEGFAVRFVELQDQNTLEGLLTQ